MNLRHLINGIFAMAGILACTQMPRVGAQDPYRTDDNSLMRIPDLSSSPTNSTTSSSMQRQTAVAPQVVTSFSGTVDRSTVPPLAWRVSAYNLALNKIPPKLKWTLPISFDKTKSYLGMAIGQLGFGFKSAYPQAGQFLIVPVSPERAQPVNGQIIIVAQPISNNETVLQLITYGETRSLNQQTIQQIPQVMLMVIQRRGLL